MNHRGLLPMDANQLPTPNTEGTVKEKVISCFLCGIGAENRNAI